MIDFNEVDIRIYLPDIHRGRKAEANIYFEGGQILMYTEI